MSTYEPVHDPGVHGHAYTVRYAGQHTQPFTAVQDDAPPPCRCDEHKYGQNPGTGFVLYSGPDAVELLTNAAIRDERYKDIGAEFDQVQHSIHAEFDAQERRRARTLAPAIRAWQRWKAATQEGRAAS